MIDIITSILLFLGLFFFLGGSIGIIRFPDFYSRLHPAGKLDSMGVLLSLCALALYTVKSLTMGNFLTAAKIIFIVSFVFITSPTATHAIIDAGMRAGLKHWNKNNNQDKKEEKP